MGDTITSSSNSESIYTSIKKEMEKGDVKIIGRQTVKAAGEPWTGTMKLGEWEQMVATAFVPTIYFYVPPPTGLGSVVERLKESLAEALFHFYSLAARLERGPTGGLDLRCENQGAELIEAESTKQLADFGDFSCYDKFGPLIPMVDPATTPLHDLPIMTVQLTRFRCGSLCIGMVMSHGIADGLSASHFLVEWARLARGEPLETPPVYDRTPLRPAEAPKGLGFTGVDPPPPQGPPPVMVDEMPPMKETSMTMLSLSKAQMDKLKSLANASATLDSSTRPFSRYQVLTAHVWRCACKIKGSNDKEEEKMLAITLDARSRITPALPWNYSGSAVLMVGAVSKAGELVQKPLGFVCERIRETIGRVTNEYVQADIDDLKIVGPIGPWRGIRNPVDLSLGNPELWVISWLTLSLSLSVIDFGWGNHVHMSPGPSMMEGVTNILPGKEQGAVLVVICLKCEDVDNFKSCFYQFLD